VEPSRWPTLRPAVDPGGTTGKHVAIGQARSCAAKFGDLAGKLTLKDLAVTPIVTYEHQFAGRGKIDDAFAQAGHRALDRARGDRCPMSSKTMCQIGMGVGIVAGVAVDARRDKSGDAAVRAPVPDPT